MNESNPLRPIQASPGDAAEAERLAGEAIDANAAAYRYELHGRDGVTTTRRLTPDSARLAVTRALLRGKPVHVDGRGAVDVQHRRTGRTTYRPQAAEPSNAPATATTDTAPAPAEQTPPPVSDSAEPQREQSGGLELLAYESGQAAGLAALYRAQVWTGLEWTPLPLDPEGEIIGATLPHFLSQVFGPGGLLLRHDDLLTFSTRARERDVSLRLDPVPGARVLAPGDPVGAQHFAVSMLQRDGRACQWVPFKVEGTDRIRARVLRNVLAAGAERGVVATLDVSGVVKVSGLFPEPLQFRPVEPQGPAKTPAGHPEAVPEDTTPAPAAPVHLGSRFVAKVLRSHLKAAFPGARISVRCGTGTAYSWLRIAWTDGPSEREVQAVCEPWHGSRFNGMTDGYDQCEPLMVALEPGALPVAVSPAVDGINYDRQFSPETKRSALDLLSEHHGRSITIHEHSLPMTEIDGQRISGGTGWTQFRDVVDKVVLRRRAQD
ncbi:MULTISPECIES: LPD29 domain-containing protein [Streptacidiphilus]|uniref:LPD29 domain-containing protein n=1 Tax=Streptacidiphilus cavernicola TaxID=3342716 RepID=A0ABV6UWG9_9ACTN|nr:LPD29 domain-containing protein [Streptacidiphilus jeojiense]